MLSVFILENDWWHEACTNPRYFWKAEPSYQIWPVKRICSPVLTILQLAKLFADTFPYSQGSIHYFPLLNFVKLGHPLFDLQRSVQTQTMYGHLLWHMTAGLWKFMGMKMLLEAGEIPGQKEITFVFVILIFVCWYWQRYCMIFFLV